jgi:hypothetical protein
VAHAENHGYLASLIEGSEASPASEYLTVISADDLVRRPDAFERQIAMLRQWPDAGFCFSHYDRVLGAEAKPLGTQESFDRDTVIPGPQIFQRIVRDAKMPVLHTGTMIRRTAYAAAGGYARDVRFAVDFALWLALSLRGDVAYVACALYAYRSHEEQMSRSLEGYHESIRETIELVDAACAEAKRKGIETGQLRREAIASFLSGWAMHEAFSGLRVSPLRRCWETMKLRPLAAITSMQLWIVVVRVLLGGAVFSALRSAFLTVAAPVRRRAPAT